jgi:hypothetical protein
MDNSSLLICYQGLGPMRGGCHGLSSEHGTNAWLDFSMRSSITNSTERISTYNAFLNGLGIDIDEAHMAGVIRFLDALSDAVEDRIIVEKELLRRSRPRIVRMATTFGLRGDRFGEPPSSNGRSRR